MRARVPTSKNALRCIVDTRALFLQDSGHRIRFVYTTEHTWLDQVEIWFNF